MIEFKNVSFKYSNSENGTLNNVNLKINKGECVLLCGTSGCGKTTITRFINGLIPHFYEGDIQGEVTVAGLNIVKTELYEIAKYVGSVFQNPRSQFFCVDTTSEIAFGCENIGIKEELITKRIEQVSNELNIKNLLGRNIFDLSGGEKQKIACASVSALNPEVFVLDEPTSNLDIYAIEELKTTLKLWKEQGKTIVIAEHRLSWLKDICDRVVYINSGEIGFDIPMNKFSKFDAKKCNKYGLRKVNDDGENIVSSFFRSREIIELNNFICKNNKDNILNIPKLSLPMKNIIAIIGHNGAGKSTFCRCLCGLERHFKGYAIIDSKKLNSKKMLKRSYMVMQDTNHQLFCESVEEEIKLGMNENNSLIYSQTLKELDLDLLSTRHPMSLSGGQKQRVAIATALLANKDIIIFDEPTSGLDFCHMEQASKLISSLKGDKTVLVITHDIELICRCCTHILHLEHGEVFDNYELDNEGIIKLNNFFRSKMRK